MYTCMEYTLYDTIYSDVRTLQMHVQTPPPQKKKKKQTNKQTLKTKKKNKQTNKQTNKNLSSPHLQNDIWPQLKYVFIKATKISSCIKYYTMLPVAWTVKIYGMRCLRSQLSMINK